MKKIIFLCLVPMIIIASSHEGVKDFDIIPRTLNFLIFFGILFYFLKDYAQKAYKDRINLIASKLDAIQNKLNDSKSQKEQAAKDIEEARNGAARLMEVAYKEIEIIKQKTKENAQIEINNLKKSYENKKEFEAKKMTKQVVNEILNQSLDNDSMKFSQKDLVNIVYKKVV
ncbi:F0F1 ATP synthase subunit B [Campylobacter sp. FMV-PI01]|uniref:ATP synthase subunit b n=1 Tax=Campylobacter portucalensis TaxID=2608384 RepID=A0A6L5WHW5_9BACT|nr:F0F1 ATP synthase subunit B [Campylobacter portucalensis]MSN96634.1 F0F1 ATP synthase subunit B [Campylobacter portucalensis]